MGSSRSWGHPLVVLVLLLPGISLSLDLSLNDDVLGLIVFKADLHDPQSKLASWNEDDDSPCTWIGVKCDPTTNRVVELVLDGFSLSGKVGRGLLQLQSLRKLSLSKNNFTGSFSPDLARLESLKNLDLSENRLSGPIPDGFFGQCKSLMEVSLAKNGFTGELPANVCTCSTLTTLDLSSNRFSGVLPVGLWSLNALRSLDLSWNSFSGEIPSGMSKLFNLRDINLKDNLLSGPLPDDIGSCELLKSIDFSDNRLSGTLPDSLQKLTTCGFLNLRGNSFTGEIPSWIGEIGSLEVLDLSENRFSGGIPDSVGNLAALKELDLSGNGLTGALPESFSGGKSLLWVDFSCNLLTGALPRWVFEVGVQEFSASWNKLSGEIQIAGTSSRTLRVLDLSGNAFSGKIPLEIKSIEGLQLLNLSQNNISGAIPLAIGELKNLEVLDLGKNQLNGTIPPEIAGAVSLKELSLQKNHISGRIPTQIENCSYLTSMILSWNNLSGPIPPNIANLSNLQIVDLTHNSLSGSLPKQLANLGHLLVFNISYNHLSGDLPAGNFFNTIPSSSVVGNPSICGAVVNVSCPSVLPKPIVLNPNDSAPDDSPLDNTMPSNIQHKKIILSISALIAIAAAALITLGIIAITVLNLRVRSSSASHSAAALALSEDYYSRSPGTDAHSGKLVMFSGNDPDFSTGAHAVLNKDCELGRGGFGAVYKTLLQDGRPVAIKKLTVSSLVKSQDDFEREVKNFGKVHHLNLVKLEGYYWTPSLQLLIYEFVSRGNLYKHLHESPESILSWQERFDIILGIARGLAHLHHLNIIHYNLKSSNVLIDDSGEPKVGDYGLAKLLPMLDRYVLSSKIQSALGYMAPEFACRTVKITEKCDVYGFGVLLLEIVTGKRPVEYMEDDVVVLCDMVRGALEEGRVEECVDVNIQGNFPTEEAVPVIKLGLICTSQVPSNRPDMPEVVNILELIRCPQESQDEELS